MVLYTLTSISSKGVSGSSHPQFSQNPFLPIVCLPSHPQAFPQPVGRTSWTTCPCFQRQLCQTEQHPVTQLQGIDHTYTPVSQHSLCGIPMSSSISTSSYTLLNRPNVRCSCGRPTADRCYHPLPLLEMPIHSLIGISLPVSWIIAPSERRFYNLLTHLTRSRGTLSPTARGDKINPARSSPLVLGSKARHVSTRFAV